ncbi:hypothetical protein TSUD_74290 [Trifolium subterraneum]|nr:hypothetical protein TSUD_74290 [Trifolium subterraneum]
MPQEDVENPSPSSKTISTPPHITHPEVAVVPQQTLPKEKKYFPWLIIIVVVIYVGIFVIEMFINNCQKHIFPRKAVFPLFLVDSHFNEPIRIRCMVHLILLF